MSADNRQGPGGPKAGGAPLGGGLDALLDDARRLHQAGRLPEAEGRYREALALAPESAQVRSKLGAALAGQGRLEDAVGELKRALEADPASIDAHNNLGVVWQLMRRPDEAAAQFEHVLAIDPGHVSAHVNLGNLRRAEGRLEDAVRCYQGALAGDPDSTAAHNGLGVAFLAQGRTDEAAQCFRTVLDAEPDNAEALNNLGSLLRNEGDLKAAVASFRHAIEARPALIQAHINLGNALRVSGDVDGAAASLERALALDPDNAEAHWNYAQVLLLRGQFKEGWAAYEWRAKCEEFRPLFPAFRQPRWEGGDLGGKTVLIFAEQGFGDAIQFVRYAPIVAALGGTVVLQCRPALERLFAAAPGIDRTVTEIDDSLGFDLQAPLLSLPHLFETDLDTIPDAVPYLLPPAGAGVPLPADDGLKVGIAWAGNLEKKASREYSIDLGRFGSLLETDRCAFFSLQVGPARNDIAGEGFGDRLADLGQGFGDFADTAAAIQALDLVISIDTAVAHLAGALGKPVWTLLACVPDWRWLLGRDDSPWYPTMRLFRQPAPGDWESVFAEVADALRRQADAAGA